MVPELKIRHQCVNISIEAIGALSFIPGDVSDLVGEVRGG